MSRPDSEFVYELEEMLGDTNKQRILYNSNENHIREFLTQRPNYLEGTQAIEAARVWELFGTDATSEGYGMETGVVDKWLEKAFVCRRSVEYGVGENNLRSLFYFSITGLLSKDIAQVRVILENSNIPDVTSENWVGRLREGIMKSTILLVRKSNGWGDINEARSIIKRLHEEQKEYEERYLRDSNGPKVSHIIALYNLVKIVDLSIEYISEGSPSGVLDKLERFSANVSKAITMNKDTDISLMHDMVYLGCKKIVKNSLWYQSRGLATGSKMKEYIESLSQHDITKPIFELMPSQQEALSQDPLSFYQRAIVINMPTSAGKTLLAEFSIVQSKSVNEESLVIYLVPTRALVNQTTLNLRRKLNKIDLSVESAVPAFELDPTEDEFLKGEIDVLVSTPEKLDLLIKDDHPVVSDISLVVADEAHNIQGGQRGANLELLLSTINREYENVRFLLLSPFVPNSEEIAKWLGGEEQSKKISVDWRATDQVTGISRVRKKRNGPEYVELNVIPSSTNPHIKDDFSINLMGKTVDGNRQTKKKASASTALNLISEDGTVLILCMSKRKALDRAREILPHLDEIQIDEEVGLVIDFIKEELGEDHFLINMLRNGVGIHHAGIPMEIRYLMERLAEQGKIKILTATTTLAQGVNFPIKHIVIEGTYLRAKPPKKGKHLSSNQFWNIAGRAGRAFKDHMGGIFFAAGNTSHFDDYKEYIESDADKVLSSLCNALKDLEDVQQEFDLEFIRRNEEFASFIRYILHTVNVSSYQSVQSDLEDVLRSSLAYYHLKEEDPELAIKLIQLTRRYLEDIGVIAKNKSMLNLIDSTGFTSVSVRNLLGRRESTGIMNERLWQSNRLFARETNNMKSILNVVKDIPEVDLGRFTGDDINIDDIAGIVKEWVNGATVEEISDLYFEKEQEKEERIILASDYVNNTLMGYISWGVSALQKVSAFRNEDFNLEEIGHIPTMIFYGVNTEEAAALRMVGVPRNLSEGLGDYYKENFERQPSFTELRNWLKNLDAHIWDEASGFENINGERAKKLWKILNGLE